MQRPADLPFYQDLRANSTQLDGHLVLFGVNMLLVLAGYTLAVRFGFGVLPLVRAVRTALAFGGLLWLLLAQIPARWPRLPGRHARLAAYALAALATTPFAAEPLNAFGRWYTVVPFWAYVSLLAAHMQTRYGPADGLRRFAALVLCVYLFPVLTFYLQGNPFARLNIYGDESRGFYSNQFGWASAICMAALLDLRRHLGRSLWRTMAWALGLAACAWLVLISGSRSSYFAVILSIGVVVALGRGVSLWARVGILAAAVGLSFYLLDAEESALNLRLRKTQQQYRTEEPRIRALKTGFHVMETQEHRIVTGIGFDSFLESIRILTGKPSVAPHNSYLEIFIDTGALVFAVFVLLLVLPALYKLIRYDVSRFALALPLLIIPYFENNLGPGQYMFFPWMFMLCWYMHDARP